MLDTVIQKIHCIWQVCATYFLLILFPSRFTTYNGQQDQAIFSMIVSWKSFSFWVIKSTCLDNLSSIILFTQSCIHQPYMLMRKFLVLVYVHIMQELYLGSLNLCELDKTNKILLSFLSVILSKFCCMASQNELHLVIVLDLCRYHCCR